MAILSAALLVSCGDDDDVTEDPQAVLEDASTALAGVSSGDLDAALSLDISADELSQGESVRLQGPFVRNAAEAPQLQFTVTLSQQIGDASLSPTEFTLSASGGAATLQVGDQTYEVAPGVVRRFEQLTTAPQTTGGESGTQTALDLSDWFIDPSNEGTEDIGGTEVDHISGPADLEQIAADLSPFVEGLGLDATSELDGLGKSLDEAEIDLYVGTEDQVPRRGELALRWSDRLEGGEPFDGAIDVSIDLSEIDQPQEITTPEGAQPLRQESIDKLPAQLSGLGEFLAGAPAS